MTQQLDTPGQAHHQRQDSSPQPAAYYCLMKAASFNKMRQNKAKKKKKNLNFHKIVRCTEKGLNFGHTNCYQTVTALLPPLVPLLLVFQHLSLSVAPPPIYLLQLKILEGHLKSHFVSFFASQVVPSAHFLPPIYFPTSSGGTSTASCLGSEFTKTFYLSWHANFCPYKSFFIQQRVIFTNKV